MIFQNINDSEKARDRHHLTRSWRHHRALIARTSSWATSSASAASSDWVLPQQRHRASPGWAPSEDPNTKIKDIGVGSSSSSRSPRRSQGQSSLPHPATSPPRRSTRATPSTCSSLRTDPGAARASPASGDQPQAQRDRADLRFDHHHPRRHDHRDDRCGRGRRGLRPILLLRMVGWTSNTASRPPHPPSIGDVLMDVKNWTSSTPSRRRPGLVVKNASLTVRKVRLSAAGPRALAVPSSPAAIFGQPHGTFPGGPSTLQRARNADPYGCGRDQRWVSPACHRGP